jgi:hypothetical protein
VRARNPQWRRIESREINRHHNVLYQDFLCAGEGRKATVKNVKEALQLLKYGAPRPAAGS